MSMHHVLHSFAYCLDFLRAQVADVPPAQMAAQPDGILNHPAWVVGHLTLVCQEIGGVIGVAPWLPVDWAERYGSGRIPVSDVAAYVSKDEALAALGDAQVRVTRAVEGLDDAARDQPFPDPAYADVFPTVGHALTQVLVGHTGYHVGQLGLWRKALRMPPLGRSFE